MVFENLQSVLELDSSGYTSGVDDATDSSEELSDSTEEASESLFELDAAGAAAGGALAGLGTGMQKTLDDTADMREILGRTAVGFGTTRDEAENMAQEISDMTFPMEDAVDTLDLLAQAGVDNQETAKELAGTFDTLGDATGASAAEVTDAVVPAIRLLEGDLEDANEHVDTFAYVARNTTMDVNDFASVINKVGPQMRDMNMSMDDAAALLSTLEDQGLTGTQAMRELRQAMRESDGDMEDVLDTLDLSKEAFEENAEAVAEAEGTTQEYADAANESLTPMDRVREEMEDLKLKAGTAMEPVAALAPVMQATGAAALTMSTINMSAVVPSFAAVQAAAAPLVLPLLGIAAAAAALYVAWDRNLFGIRDIAANVFGRLKTVLAGFRATLGNLVDWVKLLLSGDFATAWTQAKQTVVGIVTNLGTRIKTIVTDAITGIVEWVRDLGKEDLKAAFNAIGSGIRTVVLTYLKVGGKLWELFTGFVSSIATYLREDAKGDLKAAARAAWDGIKTAISAGIGAVTPSDGLIVQMITDIGAYLKNDAPGDLKKAAEAAWGGIMAAAKGLYQGLIGESLIPDMISDIGSYLKNEAASDLKDAAKDAAQAMWDGLKEKFNRLTPPPISIPTRTIGGGSVSLPSRTIAGKTIGGGRLPIPSETIGGQSVGLPSLQEGGHIEREGLAMLHAGEDVVPSAEVDRGASGSGALEEKLDEFIRYQQKMLRAVEESGGDVRMDGKKTGEVQRLALAQRKDRWI